MDKATLAELVANQTDLVYNNTPAAVGYVSTYTKIEGMDIIISLLIVITIFMGVIVYNTLNRSDEL
jgi:hypothetical protein